jgi:hypothetical protein
MYLVQVSEEVEQREKIQTYISPIGMGSGHDDAVSETVRYPEEKSKERSKYPADEDVEKCHKNKRA